MWLTAAIFVILLNMGYGLWRVFDDLVAGRRLVAVLGFACLLGVNAIIGWIIYSAVAGSTDL
jgi:hypothetical protein